MVVGIEKNHTKGRKIFLKTLTNVDFKPFVRIKIGGRMDRRKTIFFTA